jgi:endonuclease/exonuclease/phosphatase family metal-dependent hydrolase
MAAQQRYLRFAWWNLHDFAHFDRNRRSHPRWPQRKSHHTTKRDRVLAALDELFGTDYPDLLALCEITREAAVDLRNSLPAGFNLIVPPPLPRDDGFQVAVFFRPAAGLTEELPLLPFDEEDVTEETRPMLVAHCSVPGHVIRFVACHWTALDVPSSSVARQRLADVLRRNTYEFLDPATRPTGRLHHIVVLGDLNEEPTAPLFDERLTASRDRASSRETHWRDREVRRVRLYNAAWRFLGEREPHGLVGPQPPDISGTYFGAQKGWRTLDQVLVTEGLLSTNPPFLDETQTRIMSTPLMRDSAGRPVPFEPTAATAPGVSDHFPIVGRITLPEGTT